VLEQRCLYARNNQAMLRRDVLSGILDAVNSDSHLHASQTGASVILPASITCTPRFMHQLYQDALAIVRACGAPDLFITITTNPKWPELLAALKAVGASNWSDRTDIVGRIFKQKLTELLHDITHHHVLGNVLAHMHVVEWQKG
jgi:hypothetical protein